MFFQNCISLVALFAGVWGAGTETAKQWFAQGFRTLDDLRKRARLTRTQQIGLKYYNDFILTLWYKSMWLFRYHG